jgi:hypothetical protein
MGVACFYFGIKAVLPLAIPQLSPYSSFSINLHRLLRLSRFEEHAEFEFEMEDRHSISDTPVQASVSTIKPEH